jgi:hypothetical protein
MEYLALWSPLNDVLDTLKFDLDEFLRKVAE